MATNIFLAELLERICWGGELPPTKLGLKVDAKSPHKHGQKRFIRLYLVVITQVLPRGTSLNGKAYEISTKGFIRI